MSRLTPLLGLLVLSLALVGCDSDSDTVCTNVGACTHGGSDSWVSTCKSQNDDLSDEAQAVGCGAQLDAYFSCADDHFDCTGNQSSFPGCDGKLNEYSACLANKAGGTSCAALETAVAACGDDASDMSVNDPTALQPCTASGDCSARCYLDNLENVCTPTAAELAAFADCASHCVF